MKEQTYLFLGWPKGEQILSLFLFWVNYSLKGEDFHINLPEVYSEY